MFLIAEAVHLKFPSGSKMSTFAHKLTPKLHASCSLLHLWNVPLTESHFFSAVMLEMHIK